MGKIRSQGFQNTIITFAGAALGALNKIILLPTFVTKEELGLANILMMLAMMFSQLASFGFVNVSLRYFPYFRDEQKGHKGFLFLVMAVTLSFFTLISLLFFVFEDLIAAQYQEKFELLAEYLGFVIPLALGIMVFNLMTAYLRSNYKTVIPVFFKEIGIRTMTIGLILAYSVNWLDFHAFVVLYASMYWVLNVFIFIYVAIQKLFFVKPDWAFYRSGIVRKMMIYGLFTVFSSFCITAATTIDSMMLGSMVGGKEVGIYTTMIYVASLIVIPSRSIINIASPFVADGWKENNMQALGKLVKKTSTTGLVIGMLLFCGIWVNLDSLFALMPKKGFELGKYVVLLIGLSKLFTISCGVNGAILVNSPKFRVDLFFILMLIPITIISNLFFIELWGINGAAIATLSSLFLFELSRLLFVFFNYKIHPYSKGTFYTIAVGAIAIGVVLILPIPDGWHPLIQIGIRSLVCVAIYGPLVLWLKISPDVNSMVTKYWKKFRGQ